MWVITAIMLLLISGHSAWSQQSNQLDGVLSAKALCIGINEGLSEFLTEPCQYSGWNQVVQITLNISSQDASMACQKIIDGLRGKTLKFENGWLLKIYSPYSGERSIAFCDLSKVNAP